MKKQLLVCCGTGCVANGSRIVMDELKKAAERYEKDVSVEVLIKQTGCNGFCENGPIVKIMPDDITYYKVKPVDADEIIARLYTEDEVVERLLYKNEKGERVRSQHENPFYISQQKIATRNIGTVDPCSIDDYLENKGYQALRKALKMSGREIIDEILESGIRGRGGGGFPTGKKWEFAAVQDSPEKYVCCNADEGDPGAFMDRSILEGDPHSVIEGMEIAALAIGATRGYMYIRDEYGLALENVSVALEQARARGYLGKHIMGSAFDFDIEIVRGGGAFVCGEETALLKSVEGYVGEPVPKPPFPAVKGLFGKPTIINNVETLANIPYILLHGGKEYGKIGTPGNSGTKVFALVGKVKRTGLVEVPMGTTLRQLIFDIGGGIIGDRPFKAVQTGGPSGGCIGEDMLDIPMDFDQLKAHGSMIGSGGVIVMDDRSCMVEVARYYVNFLCGESCGKCTPCREGLRRMLEILTDICEGRGTMEDLDILETIAQTMGDASLCALGKTAMNPVMTTLRNFRDEYEAHIREHRCPAGVCTKLTEYYIEKEACRGCSACSRICPADAISGKVKEPFVIDPAKCITCGSCRDACRFDAVKTRGRRG